MFSAIMLIAIVAALFYLARTSGQLGGRFATDLSAVSLHDIHNQPHYQRQLDELVDVNAVLRRRCQPGDKVTDSIEAIPYGTSTDAYAVMRPQKKTYMDFDDIVDKPVSEDTKVMVAGHQPYFLQGAEIIDYYGEKFYHDARFPQQPISVQFASDPERFCREHPNEYPSYVIAARNGKKLFQPDLAIGAY